MQFHSVTVLIYATDESKSLIETVKGFLSLNDKNDINKIVIVYPKNATPSCKSAILLLKKHYPKMVDSVEQEHPFLGGAINDSKKSASSSHVLLSTADLAIDLSFIPKMITEEKAFPDAIVKASRWLKPDSFHNYPPIKKYLNKIAQKFLRVLYHSTLTDFTNSVQILPSDLFKEIQIKERKAAVMLELVLIPVKMGVKIREIPTEYYGREEGKSKNSFLQTILYLRTALRIRFFTKVDKIK